MRRFQLDFERRRVVVDGVVKFWWKTPHKSSTSSEEASERRVWYCKSDKHGYHTDQDGNIIDKKKKLITELKRLESEAYHDAFYWEPAEHRITDPERLTLLNRFVDAAWEHQREIEQKRKREEREKNEASARNQSEHDSKQDDHRPLASLPFERISTKKMKSGNLIYKRRSAGDWLQLESRDAKTYSLVPKQHWSELNRIFSRLKEPASADASASSKRKRPKFAERNKHGGLNVRSAVNPSYYTRFDVNKSRKHRGLFTFRMGRGKFQVYETLDQESLAAIAKEISWALQS